MKAWFKPLGFGVFVACLAHFLMIGLFPSVIMSIAMNRIAASSGGMNTMFNSDLVTPQNQVIVRSSPDLAYSTCALDLSNGPVRVYVGKGAEYTSVAFYAANTDNVFTLSDSRIGSEGASLLVVSARSPIQAATGETMISLPSDKGLMLIRRLAPSAAAYARVNQERAGDMCAPVTP